mmetsp:Transcript_29092/g.65108  ORF Transcript_29092/g.65108 Transcript_29092/m.65108 type:complete len:184 (-) Transcript_29092:243-794(-)
MPGKRLLLWVSRRGLKPQYASVVWPLSEAQTAEAQRQIEALTAEGRIDSKAEEAWSVVPRPPVTAIKAPPPTARPTEARLMSAEWHSDLPTGFYPAEAYHQRFWPKAKVRFAALAAFFAVQQLAGLGLLGADVSGGGLGVGGLSSAEVYNLAYGCQAAVALEIVAGRLAPRVARLVKSLSQAN